MIEPFRRQELSPVPAELGNPDRTLPARDEPHPATVLEVGTEPDPERDPDPPSQRGPRSSPESICELGDSTCTDTRSASPDLEELGERIAELSAQIQAATYHLLVMIREFDEWDGWHCGFGEYGFRSCAHWLNWRTGLDMGAAREKVRVARALGDLPQISEAMRRGELSYSKVRALTRVATAENEAELLGFAKAGTASHVEKLVRAWRRVDRNGEAEQEDLRRASRYLHAFTDEDGMLVLRARLEPEVGAAVMKALEAAGEALYRRDRQDRDVAETIGAATANRTMDKQVEMNDDSDTQPEDEVNAEQRRADAIGLIADAALAHGLEASPRGERLQVVVHVDAEVLEDPRQPGISMLGTGENVSAETSRRLACDSARVVMKHDLEGKTIDVGRRTRAISTALRRALSHRDRACQFPGCDVGCCEAHHVQHWANGGSTDLENLVLLCRRHHRAVHEGGFRVERLGDGHGGSDFRFIRPDGREIPTAPAAPVSSAEPLAALVRRLQENGVSIDSQTGLPSWDGGPIDLAWAVDGYRRLGDVSAETS